MRNPSSTMVNENRAKLDTAMIGLAEMLGPVIGEVVREASQTGHWSLDHLRPEMRRNIRTPADLAQTQDLSLILAIMLEGWDSLEFEDELPAYDITYQMLDKVRRIRNEFAHNQGNYGDTRYVDDCLKIINDLSGLVSRLRNQYPTAPQSGPSVENYVSQGRAHLQAGDRNKAILACSDAINLSGNDPQAFSIRGTAYREQGDHDHAVLDFTKAIGLSRNDRDAYVVALNERGRTYLQKKDFDKAVRDFDEAINLDSSKPYLWYNVGVAHENTGRMQLALNYFDRALGVDSNYALARAERGILYCNSGQYDLALEELGKAIALDAGTARVWNSRGWAYIQKKKYSKAVVDLKRAVQIQPNFNAAIDNLRIARQQQRKRIIRWGLVGLGILGIIVVAAAM